MKKSKFFNFFLFFPIFFLNFGCSAPNYSGINIENFSYETTINANDSKRILPKFNRKQSSKKDNNQSQGYKSSSVATSSDFEYIVSNELEVNPINLTVSAKQDNDIIKWKLGESDAMFNDKPILEHYRDDFSGFPSLRKLSRNIEDALFNEKDWKDITLFGDTWTIKDEINFPLFLHKKFSKFEKEIREDNGYIKYSMNPFVKGKINTGVSNSFVFSNPENDVFEVIKDTSAYFKYEAEGHVIGTLKWKKNGTLSDLIRLNTDYGEFLYLLPQSVADFSLWDASLNLNLGYSSFTFRSIKNSLNFTKTTEDESHFSEDKSYFGGGLIIEESRSKTKSNEIKVHFDASILELNSDFVFSKIREEEKKETRKDTFFIRSGKKKDGIFIDGVFGRIDEKIQDTKRKTGKSIEYLINIDEGYSRKEINYDETIIFQEKNVKYLGGFVIGREFPVPLGDISFFTELTKNYNDGFSRIGAFGDISKINFDINSDLEYHIFLDVLGNHSFKNYFKEDRVLNINPTKNKRLENILKQREIFEKTNGVLLEVSDKEDIRKIGLILGKENDSVSIGLKKTSWGKGAYGSFSGKTDSGYSFNVLLEYLKNDKRENFIFGTNIQVSEKMFIGFNVNTKGFRINRDTGLHRHVTITY